MWLLLEVYIIINFRVRKISLNARKLVRTSILIKKKKVAVGQGITKELTPTPSFLPFGTFYNNEEALIKAVVKNKINNETRNKHPKREEKQK